MPRSIEAESTLLLKNFSEREIIQWMFDGFNLPQTGYKDDRSNLTRVQPVYKRLDSKTRTKLDDSLVQAVSEWNPVNDGPQTLRNLALFTAYTGNINALRNLIKIVDTKTILPDKENDESEAFTTIVAVVCGFAPQDIARDTLSRWYDDDSFNWRCTALLACGLATCHPNKIGLILPKLLRTIDREPSGYFRPDFIVYQLADIVGPDILERALKNFDNKSAKTLLNKLPMAKKILKDLAQQ